ncbi:tetratricopeptide (TPR) repeat protein [Oikeobacillus pervagus]|uniref:Tetratricopeptide (TPR) repeat protein n=1 Tax=Oikeobacillus pervagus TaxID=1325931 RepID=A0AAJ1WFX6_9BACI|nr:SEC-C metal-binding domain-containing protein [Oikeobacillus pervagus]MDQ0214442.1 tetratricopeptide (TPR) repeat protein [Oikeobacillus pervagus]
MKKIGRNDLCPCGSGKKYKKCCGKSNVVSMDRLVENELKEIQLDIFQYSRKYSVEIDEYVEELCDDFDVPYEALDIFHFFVSTWYITYVKLSGQTILEEFIDGHLHTFTRQRIKEIVKSWAVSNITPSISMILEQDNQLTLTLQDIFTNEVKKVKELGESRDVEVGGLVLGTILPAGEKNVFLTSFIDLPSGQTDGMQSYLLKLYEDSGKENPKDFTSEFFPEILSLFMFGIPEQSMENLTWNLPEHKKVADEFMDYMSDVKNSEIVTDLGLLIWHRFCEKRNPKIKKVDLYVAVLVYFVSRMSEFSWGITQKRLAEEFNVSASSISAKYNEMEEIFYEEINRLKDENLSSFYDEEDIDSSAPFNTRMTMERELRKLERKMENMNFESLDEVNEFMNQQINHPKTASEPLSNKEKAQELLFDAYETTGPKRFQLAKKALKLYPNSPDAYLILAEEYEWEPLKQLKLYRKGIEAGEKDLGHDFFKKNKGHFWGIVSTRPYMRVKYEYGVLLMDLQKYEEAIKQLEDLLALNPSDNQGVRYELFLAYVECGLLNKAKSLLMQYPEVTANGAYNEALLGYLENGLSNKVKIQMGKAKEKNPYVIDFLIGKKKLPLSAPAAYQIGETSEAIIYAIDHHHIWNKHPEAIEWLKRI